MNAMKRTKALLLTTLLTLVLSGPTLAATVTVDLVVEPVNKTMPDATVVPMWGMRLATSPAGSATVPGPVIAAVAGDTLVINLTNNLTAEPVSLVINGQTSTSMVPTWTDDSTGARGGDVTKRVRSFTHEAAAFDTGTSTPGTATYEWTNLKAGTYLLTSGTHPAVQVPMGLYAAVKVDAALGQAYSDPATAYAGEAVLLFSEVDPALNNAVAGGTYGTTEFPTALAIRSEPKYFLINGAAYSAASVPLPVAGAGQNTLLRFLNAGIHGRVPVLQNEYMTLVADDGSLLPDPSQVYSLELAAGKRYDAIIQPAATGILSIHDRTGGLANGGMLAYLGVGTSVLPTSSNIGAFEGGIWYLDANGNGIWDGVAGGDLNYTFGTSAMLPVTGDWNTDGQAEIAAYDNGIWYLDVNGNGTWDGVAGGDATYTFGTSAMKPVSGDWNNDGKSEIGAYENGVWYLDVNGNGAWDGVAGGDVIYLFGTSAMTPVVGDWNSDGQDEIGAYENGIWYLDVNGNGIWDGVAGGDATYTFGTSAMSPVAFDWNSDGNSEIGAYENGIWYLDVNGNGVWDGIVGGDATYTFGTSAMFSVSGLWQ